MNQPDASAALSTPRKSIGRSVVIVILFAATLIGVCEILARLLPPTEPEIAAQCRYFAERKDEFDTLFIGSSRIRFHVDPQQFDAETSALGQPTHSLNMGYAGMWPPESYYYLRQLLAMHPRRLRWVFIELIDYRFGQVEYLGLTKRVVIWHDWKHTAVVCRRVIESSQPIGEKSEWLAKHLGCCLYRSMGPGRGADWLHARYFPAKKKAAQAVLARGGFEPQGKADWNEAAQAEYARELQAFEQAPAQPVRPGLASALREVIAEVRNAGAEPILVLPPSARADDKLGDGLPSDVKVWAFNRPAEFPELYRPENLHDSGHLNEDGAHLFTRLLAQRLVDSAKER